MSALLAVVLTAAAGGATATKDPARGAQATVRRADAERSPTRGHGKYVTIWKRRPRGAWRVAVDIGNGEPPPERDFGPPPLP